MVRVARAGIDFPTDFTFSVSEFASILIAGDIETIQSSKFVNLHHGWERLLVQYVERATLRWPEYQQLKKELERLKLAASKGHRAFASACRALDTPVTDPTKEPGYSGYVGSRPAHVEEALDILEPELVRQLGDQWRAFLDDEVLDLNAIRELLRLQIADYKATHGVSGRERQPDLEWFIFQAADLFAALGGNVAANGRERVTPAKAHHRDGPFVKALERALQIAADHATRVGVSLPRTGDLGEVVRGVIKKRRMISEMF